DMRGAIAAERAQASLAMLGRAQLALTLATSSAERDAAVHDITEASRHLDAAVDGVRQAAPAQARALLAEFGAEPLLALDLRLGEGTGAALAWPLVASVAAFLREMATFSGAGVSNASA
ncbi:UNVERIFIED_CONTAM: nicotinate-nucleotide--dimethylbenzimidazole phosphoribosyltransferase, partial [Microbacterium sp. SLM126]